MKKTKKLVLFGYTDFAQIAYEYFTVDTEFEVVAFCADRERLTIKSQYGLPIVAFEDIEKLYSPTDHYFYGASVYTQLNRVRTRVMNTAKSKGYRLASYISPRAFVWRNVELGEHVFIFEDNTVQPFTKIGSNVVMWSGNHIGHHTIVEDNCFLSSHVVISGGCVIGANTFIGVNATVNNMIKIGPDCLIASGALIYKDVPQNSIVKGMKVVENASAKAHYRVEE